MTCTKRRLILLLMSSAGSLPRTRSVWRSDRRVATGTARGAFCPARPTGRFLRLWWYEPGLENGNPVTNRRFRVNAPEVVTHPTFATRPEAKSSGMLQVRMHEDLSQLRGAELYLELWGGHPGTANRRVTVNGRTTYLLPGLAATPSARICIRG